MEWGLASSLGLLPVMCANIRWLGHILRSPKDRLIHEALQVQLELNSPGNLFLDAPNFSDMDDLRRQAMVGKSTSEASPMMVASRQCKDNGRPGEANAKPPLLRQPINAPLLSRPQSQRRSRTAATNRYNLRNRR